MSTDRKPPLPATLSCNGGYSYNSEECGGLLAAGFDEQANDDGHLPDEKEQ
jgi:hypothetical protein